MRASSPTSVSSFFIPDGLLLLAAVAFLRPTGLPQWTGMLVLLYDYLVLGAAVLVAWYVGVSRVVLGTLLLILADGALRSAGAAGASASTSRLIFNAIGLLLPLNFLALSLIHERRFMIRREAVWLVVVFVQTLLIAALCVPMPATARAAITASLAFEFIDPRYAAWTALSQPTLLAFALALLLMSLRFFIRGSRLDRGFLWALAAMFTALHGAGLGWSPTNYLATAGLILILGVYADEYRLSHYDDLTGIPGREAFVQALRALRGHYTIALVDIDELKHINERYGEAGGNRAVQVVATKCRQTRGGEAFRVDSDKFALIFSGKTVSEALNRLEGLRSAVQDAFIRVPWRCRVANKNGHRAPSTFIATVSIGVAESHAIASKPDQVIVRAEHALARAKQAGRNEVRTAAD